MAGLEAFSILRKLRTDTSILALAWIINFLRGNKSKKNTMEKKED